MLMQAAHGGMLQDGCSGLKELPSLRSGLLLDPAAAIPQIGRHGLAAVLWPLQVRADCAPMSWWA
jgi:hypothetical protein